MQKNHSWKDLQKTSRDLCRLASVYPFLIKEDKTPFSALIDAQLDEFRLLSQDWTENQHYAAPRAAAMQGIAQVLHYIFQTVENVLPDSPLAEGCTEQSELNKQRHELQKKECLELLKEFKRKGIEIVLLKGMVFSHSLYGAPYHKPMVDVDFLVPESQYIRAARTTRKAGYKIIERNDKNFTLAPAGNTEYLHMWSEHPDNRRGIDLHRELSYTPLMLKVRMDDDIFSRLDEFTLDGFSIKTLSCEDSLILNCFETTDSMLRHQLKFIKLMDLALLAEKIENHRKIADFIKHKGIRYATFACPAFQKAAESLNSEICESIAGLAAPYAEKKILQHFKGKDCIFFSHVNPQREFLGRYAGLTLMNRWSEKFDVLRQFFVPSLEWDENSFFTEGQRKWKKHYSQLIKSTFSKLKNWR